MGTALIVLASDETDDRLLTAAKRYATGTDTELLVCRVVDEERYQSKLQRKAESGEDTASIDEIEESAKASAEEIARIALGDSVSYTTLGIVGDLPDDILRIADQRGCDHVFITGKERSPAGKVLFGDVAQSIILGFDGPVTVTTKTP